MNDVYKSLRAAAPAQNHFAITPGVAYDVLPLALYVESGGNLVMTDQNGTQITYGVASGAILPFRPVSVDAGTTATVVGWY